MAENKTQPTKQSVTEFVRGIEDKQCRSDVKKVAALLVYIARGSGQIEPEIVHRAFDQFSAETMPGS